MPLIKNGELASDTWVLLDDDAALPEGDKASGDVIVSVARWDSEKESLQGRNGRLGIRLSADQLADTIGQNANRFSLIVLDFPKFNDGRAYSTARLLRERYGYKGELRASGKVYRDQFLFMVRCGFDSFEVEDEGEVKGFAQAMEAYSFFYQPATDAKRPLFWRRHALASRPEAC